MQDVPVDVLEGTEHADHSVRVFHVWMVLP